MAHPTKIQNILALKGPDRYAYFVRNVMDFEEVWGLFENGWALAEDSQGHNAIPFWPEKDFAEACCSGLWEKYEPRSIELKKFLENWIPGMVKDHKLVAIFPTPSDKGVFVSASKLGNDLSDESGQYE